MRIPHIIVAASLLITLGGCNKLECTFVAPKRSPYIAFVGFPPADVDSLTLEEFEPGSNFTKQLRTYSISFSKSSLLGDTCYLFNPSSATERFEKLYAPLGGDTKLTLTSKGEIYYLTDAEYEGDSLYTFTAPSTIKGCGSGTNVPSRAITSLFINGIRTVPSRWAFSAAENGPIFYLKK